METTSDGALRAIGVRWNLGDLYDCPEAPRITTDLEWARAEAGRLCTEYRDRIGSLSVEELATALERYETLLIRGGRPSFYASLLFAADTQSEAAQALEQRVREIASEIQNELVFFHLEIQRLPDELYDRALADKRIAPWRHFLEIARQDRPHTLSEAEEKILNRKNLTSSGAFTQLYDELSGSLRFALELDGDTRALTDGEILALLHRPEPDVRRRALETFLDTWKGHALVFTSIFNNLLLDHRVESDLRSYPSLIASRHLSNDVSDRTVETMMSSVDDHAELVREYFRQKAKLVGLDRLTISDVYAPLDAEREEIPFERGRELVLDAFAGFSGQFADLARDFFEHGWIDAEVREGKRGGAFCASFDPSEHPFILTTYSGTANDVSTIAHELGHGVHARLAGKQRFLVCGAPLALAETASIFAEMLLNDHLLGFAKTPRQRAAILCTSLDEIYGTVFRQNTMTRFEIDAHEARRDGLLPADRLGDLWIRRQQALLGDSVEIPEVYRWGWIYIPHFVHSPFYCYAYSFGDLLVRALFERYRAEGASFVPAYLELLTAGGSDRPEALLADLGFDITSRAFWDDGFRPVRRLLDDLHEVVEDLG